MAQENKYQKKIQNKEIFIYNQRSKLNENRIYLQKKVFGGCNFPGDNFPWTFFMGAFFHRTLEPYIVYFPVSDKFFSRFLL